MTQTIFKSFPTKHRKDDNEFKLVLKLIFNYLNMFILHQFI